MGTRRWVGWVAVASMVTLTVAMSRVDTQARITGGTPAQQEMARWAIGRFEAAGLSVPPLEIRFHPTPRGCGDRLGRYEDGTADLCGVHVNMLSRRTLLHEIAHGWVGSTVSAGLRARFLRLRQLESWNDPGVDWQERGTEHAAEIIGWALCGQGTGTQLPSIPRHAPTQLADGYELLTGSPLPELSPPPPDRDPG